MATYCLFCGGLAPCETHTYAMFDPWQSMINAAASRGQKKATSGFTWPAAKYPNPWLKTMTLRCKDLDGKITESTFPVRPDYYFWLGADAYPEWPVVTRIVPATKPSEVAFQWNVAQRVVEGAAPLFASLARK